MGRRTWAAAAAAMVVIAPQAARAWDEAPASAREPRTATSDAGVDLAIVARRVLDRRCVSCHSDGGPAAKLSLETHASVLRGGKSGPVIVAGRPAESALVRRMTLPLHDRRHMPPSSEAQPIAAELEALRLWISAGAFASTFVPRASLDASTMATLDAAVEPRPGAAPIATEAEAPAQSPRSAAASPSRGATAAGCASCAVGGEPASWSLPLCVAAAVVVGGLVRRRKREFGGSCAGPGTR